MITVASDINSVQLAGHRVVPRLWTRTPTPATSWIQLQTLEATVTYDQAGNWPGRSLSAKVLLETDGIPVITESIDAQRVDWGHAPLSPFGSWLKAEQLVYRMDGSVIVVPWGIYRVDSLTVDELSATVTISATDASSQMGDRAFIRMDQGRVGATQMITAKMNSIISDVFGQGIVPWWSSLLDMTGTTDKAYGGKGGQYVDARMDALGALCAKIAPGWRLICPRSGAIFKAINPGFSAQSAYVTVAQNLIFADFADTVDRDGLYNEVAATYEVSSVDTYGQNRTQQRRLVAQYTDAGEELAGNGPFGWATRETVQVDIPTGTADPDGYASDRALEAMGRSFSSTRTITVQSGPIYGLEQGDTVYVQDQPDGNRRKATLAGASIPLHADGGPWSLDLLMTDPLDASWRPRYTKVVDATQYEDNFTWVELRPSQAIDLDTGTGSGKTKKLWNGWTVDNSSKLVGGTGLTATSNGSQVVFRTSGQPWAESASEHRYNAKASLTATKGTFQARIGLDTNAQGIIWGAWKPFTGGKSQTVSVDTQRLVNPAAITFGIRIETSGMNSGEEVRMNSASVDRAVRNKT